MAGHASHAASAIPFWARGPKQGLEFEERGSIVQFHATLIVPDGQPEPSSSTKLPLLIYFAGLGSPGGFKDLNEPSLLLWKLHECAAIGDHLLLFPVAPKGDFMPIFGSPGDPGFTNAIYWHHDSS